jgi:hypothetical protein
MIGMSELQHLSTEDWIVLSPQEVIGASWTVEMNG